MVRVMCDTGETVRLQDLVPFQGGLKSRGRRDMNALVSSIKEDGLIMPFVVWRRDGENLLLDGHARLEALREMSVEDPSIIEGSFPVIYISAGDEAAARRELLQITSRYGRVTREGAREFCAPIMDYRAPAVNKFIHRKLPERRLAVRDNEVVMRIAVEAGKADAVRELLRSAGYIRIL